MAAGLVKGIERIGVAPQSYVRGAEIGEPVGKTFTVVRRWIGAKERLPMCTPCAAGFDGVAVAIETQARESKIMQQFREVGASRWRGIAAEQSLRVGAGSIVSAHRIVMALQNVVHEANIAQRSGQEFMMS
jgi:hypothetical protein